MILAHHDFTYLASSSLLLLGYACYVAGIVFPSWRAETGYVYGLWQRCDQGVCTHFATGLNHYLFPVRCAFTLALLCLTMAVACLLAEMSLKRWMRRSSRRRRHLARLGRVIGVSSAFGEIIAAGGLAFYGYRTVLINDRYPVLLWGVAVTGLGVLLCQLASILRAMGSLKYWGRGLCCMAPPQNRRYKQQSPAYPALETHDYRRQVVVRDVRGVRSCCASQWSDDCSSSSIQSFLSLGGGGGGTMDSRHYRHYEEISFQDLSDMPPPPPELLDQPTPQHPPLLFQRQPVIPYPQQYYNTNSPQPLLHSGCLEIEEAPPPPCSVGIPAACCHHIVLAGSSSTWHPQQHQALHHQALQPPQSLQREHQHRHNNDSDSPSLNSPRLANSQTKQKSGRPKARPRAVRNQGVSPETAAAAHSSRRSSVQSGRRQHRPSGSGSVSSMKSSTCESPQIHRYQTMPVPVNQRN
ncbi:hypothetical protein PoB_002334200 [Plakobranchus ocellatus]|uniref:Uncharacterized protein n=1 Tax=Plakobranchus ocellatus TaxID=259542 RepID=A0AAV3ZQ89_9GAST|nr:hypothetical protein PoB_002334200 [Plakobranchus ocellatus]